MTEDVEQSVEEGVAPLAETAQQDSQQADTPAVPQQQISDEEHNWREARRKIEELERKSRDQEDYILRMQNQRQEEPEEEDDLSKLADDDIVTAKQARSLAQRMARDVAEETFRQREALSADERTKAKYPDFDQVVTRENFEALRQEAPQLAMSLQRLADDPYAQNLAAYQMLKRTGIGDMAKNQPLKAKTIENTRKPASVQTVTKSSAIAAVSGFDRRMTPELAKQLRQEMEQAAMGTG